MSRSLLTLCLLMAVLMMFACGKQEPVAPELSESSENITLAKQGGSTGGPEEATASPVLADMNDSIEDMGLSVRVAMAEWITDPTSNNVGQTVIADDRNFQLSHHWVPGDPRRTGNTNIVYFTDDVDVTADVAAGDDLAAIDRAMATWQGIQCSDIPLVDGGDVGEVGFVEFLVTGGGAPFFLFDLTHGGWLPRGFFDAIAPPDGGDFILGVTFTFIWVDGSGNPTDIDNNGKSDVAFREIYYNDNFDWAIDANFDIETVAFHEAGHGLSQGHFGKIFITNSNGKVHFAPRAAMNAVYSGVQQSPSGTDNGGHCSIWGSWPNN